MLREGLIEVKDRPAWTGRVRLLRPAEKGEKAAEDVGINVDAGFKEVLCAVTGEKTKGKD